MKKLQEILKNPNDKLIAVDLDGTLCEGEFWGEGEPKPKQEVIDLVWKIYKKGAHIIIYTARQPKYYATTLAWLIKHEVPFHGVAMFYKPGADCYIDDKGVHLEQFMESNKKVSIHCQQCGREVAIVGKGEENFTSYCGECFKYLEAN